MSNKKGLILGWCYCITVIVVVPCVSTVLLGLEGVFH